MEHPEESKEMNFISNSERNPKQSTVSAIENIQQKQDDEGKAFLKRKERNLEMSKVLDLLWDKRLPLLLKG